MNGIRCNVMQGKNIDNRKGDLGKHVGIERHYSPRIRWPPKKATEKCLSCQSLFARVGVLHESKYPGIPNQGQIGSRHYQNPQILHNY